MKKMLIALLIALMCLLSATAFAEGGYTLGDKVEDFTATLSDGSTVTLSEILKEKKAVLLNFWASWCSPCKLEMPAMNEAYGKVSDEVEFICLSIEKSDTNDTIAELRESLGLDVLPMGLDSDDLYEKFDNPDGGIPFTVVIDKNGVICFLECGSIPDANKFVSLMDVFAAEDYDQPQMVYELPSVKPDVEAPSEEAMHSAIGAENMELIQAEDGIVWPFIISENGTYAYASNNMVKDSYAAFAVRLEANAGEGVAFEYGVSDMPTYQAFGVRVDGEEIADVMSGDKDWTDNVVTFDTDGEHTVVFFFQRDTVMDGEVMAAIRNVRKVSAQEAEAIRAAKEQGIKTLEGKTAEIEVVEGEFKTALIEYGNDEDAIEQNVLLNDRVKLRIRIGQDVDFEHAYIGDNSTYIMLSELEHDDEGYFYTPTLELSDDSILDMMGKNISVYASVMDEEKEILATFSFHPSESSLDRFTDYIGTLLSAMVPEDSEFDDNLEFTWRWADGSEKESEAQASSSTLNPDGTANYTVMVTDKSGKGLENAMVQVCTTETCQVFKTDADGMVQFTDAPYPYEVHILKAPKGYARPEGIYLLAKEGGSLIVELDAE